MTNIVLTGDHAGKLVLETAEALSMPVAGYELRPSPSMGESRER